MTTATIFALAFAIICTIVILQSVQIVPMGQARIVERLGRYSRTLEPGLHLMVPIVDAVRASVDVREQTVTLPPHDVVTSDRRVLAITVEYRSSIDDPVRATYEVTALGDVMAQLVRSTLDDVVGALTADDALMGRAALALDVRRVLTEAAAGWGVRVGEVLVHEVVRVPDSRAPA